MARKLGYLVVEGPHDVEFASRLIRSRITLPRIQRIEELDATLKKLVPKEFPYGGDLLKRVPVPVFLQNDHVAIALQAAGGDSKIAACLEDTFMVIPADIFSAVGVMLDSDSEKQPQNRHANLLKLIKHLSPSIRFESLLGNVFQGQPRTGVYVFPDNQTQGTLEDLLLECGESAYPHQLNAAKAFVKGIASNCTGSAFKDLRLPAGQKKAIVGAVAGLLKPGKAVQVSIQDNAWLEGQTLQIARISKVADFLDELFELTTPQP
jgi:hypothetical protein